MHKTADVFSLPEDANTHDHEYHQLVLCLEGNTAFDIEGLGKHVKPGAGCVVPSSINHAFCGIGDNRIMTINMPHHTNSSYEEQQIIDRLFDHASYFKLDSRLQVLASALSQEIQYHPQDQLLARACGNTILCALQNYLQLPEPRRRNGMLNMDVIDQYIELNMHKTVRISHLAGLVCLSNSQFHDLFKQQNHLTPHQYLLQKRLTRARDLLQQGFTPLQVTDRCGFSSQSAFTHAFKRMFDTTPARFKKTQA